ARSCGPYEGHRAPSPDGRRDRERVMAGLVPAAVGTELVESCDLCGSRAQDVLFATVTDRLHYLPGRFSLIRCSDCALVRLSPRPDAASLPFYYPADDYSAYQPAEGTGPPDRPLAGTREVLRSA